MRCLYLLLIIVTNLVTAKINPIPLAGGSLIIPAGSLFAGGVFILRDFVQLRHGKRGAYRIILWASFLSAVLSLVLGDTAHVAVASVAAFFIGEAADTEIFSRSRRSFPVRVILSGIVGGCLDSVAFVILGLSPLGASMLPWAAVPSAVLGQMLVKTLVQAAAAAGLLLIYKRMKGGRI